MIQMSYGPSPRRRVGGTPRQHLRRGKHDPQAVAAEGGKDHRLLRGAASSVGYRRLAVHQVIVHRLKRWTAPRLARPLETAARRPRRPLRKQPVPDETLRAARSRVDDPQFPADQRPAAWAQKTSRCAVGTSWGATIRRTVRDLHRLAPGKIERPDIQLPVRLLAKAIVRPSGLNAGWMSAADRSSNCRTDRTLHVLQVEVRRQAVTRVDANARPGLPAGLIADVVDPHRSP